MRMGDARHNLSNQENAKAAPNSADIGAMSPIASSFPSTGLPSAQDSGRAALATGAHQLSQDAQQIANPANQNLTNPLLDLNNSLQLTQAGAEVISASSKMLGTLLDVFA